MQDIQGLGVGTSASVPLTLSFYANPTGNGVFCAGIIMPGGGSYIEEVTIGTSWSRHEINILERQILLMLPHKLMTATVEWKYRSH